jgi:hypothetical protein
VLAPLARALRLTDAERDHLYRVAGQAPPAGRMGRHLTPGVQRVLDRLGDVPVLVVDMAWNVVAVNALGAALLGEPRGNILRRHFAGEPSRVVRSPVEVAEFEVEAVADLHDALGRYPGDPDLRALIDELRAASPRFAELWEQRPVAPRHTGTKTFDHPEIGRVTLDCDHLTVGGSDLRLVVYTARAGSPDADALALLGAVGLQAF